MSTYPIPDNPMNRKEMYLAKGAGLDIPIPEPSNREEMYLAAIAENGGGGGGGATNLSELNDVSISSKKDGDFLVWDATANKWKNKEADTVIVNYESTENKPTINGVEVNGDMLPEDLGLASSPTVDEPSETAILG